jgi:hypothetical protein
VQLIKLIELNKRERTSITHKSVPLLGGVGVGFNEDLSSTSPNGAQYFGIWDLKLGI